MKRFPSHFVLAAAIFAAVAGFDQLTADEPFNVFEFLAEDSPEFLLFAIAISAVSYIGFLLRDATQERNSLAGALVDAVAEGNQWRAAARVHSDGLGQAIQQQFRCWQLSTSEADVAMLMLKGLSHKEIANLRNSSWATVRQQATAVYSKSGLSSRTELAAFFLEDLFPSNTAPSPHLARVPNLSDRRSIEAVAGQY